MLETLTIYIWRGLRVGDQHIRCTIAPASARLDTFAVDKRVLLIDHHSEVASEGLLGLNGLKECLEIAGTEALMIASLDDLQEESWAIFQGLGKDLQKVALVIVVDENLLALQHVNVFLNLEIDLANTCAKVVVIGVWNLV